jgi:hypothetical protein
MGGIKEEEGDRDCWAAMARRSSADAVGSDWDRMGREWIEREGLGWKEGRGADRAGTCRCKGE